MKNIGTEKAILRPLNDDKFRGDCDVDNESEHGSSEMDVNSE